MTYLRYWPFALIALLAAALWWTRIEERRTQRMLDDTQAAYDLTVEAYRRVSAERKASDLANVARVTAEANTISKDTIHDYQTRIAAVRADFAERVRLATAADPRGGAGTDLPSVPDPAGRTDATACEARFPARDALIATETAEQLVALQSWLTKVAAVDADGSP